MRALLHSVVIVTLAATIASAADQGDFLTDAEIDKVRDAQVPSERIIAYLAFAQVRIERFDDYRSRRPDPDYDIQGYLEKQLDQYIHITDALKEWIEEQFEHGHDMRVGLKKVLEEGPHQLDQLRHIEDSSDSYAQGYKQSLRDAIDDFTDALDGATKALSEQTKAYGELKQVQKVEAQTIKDKQKEEKNAAKGESKMRKKEHEGGGPPTDKDED